MNAPSLNYITQEGGLVGKKDLAAVVAELKAVEALNGKITPKLVVAAARRNRNSILRKFIDLDNVQESAMKWWLAQARAVIQSVYVYVIDDGTTLEPTRAWVSVADVSANSRKLDFTYVPIEQALSDDRYKEQLLRSAMLEIKSWQEKYKVLVSYSEIFSKLNGAITRSLKKRRKK